MNASIVKLQEKYAQRPAGTLTELAVARIASRATPSLCCTVPGRETGLIVPEVEYLKTRLSTLRWLSVIELTRGP